MRFSESTLLLRLCATNGQSATNGRSHVEETSQTGALDGSIGRIATVRGSPRGGPEFPRQSWRSVASAKWGSERGDQRHDLLRTDNGAGVIRDIDVESGVHRLMRVIGCRVSSHWVSYRSAAALQIDHAVWPVGQSLPDAEQGRVILCLT